MLKLLGILAQDITNLLTGSDDYDLQIIAGEGPTSKENPYHTHHVYGRFVHGLNLGQCRSIILNPANKIFAHYGSALAE